MITLLIIAISGISGFLVYHFFGPTLDRYISTQILAGKTVMLIVDNQGVRYQYRNKRLVVDNVTVAFDFFDDLDEEQVERE